MKTQNTQSNSTRLKSCRNILLFMFFAPIISISLIMISNTMDGEFIRKSYSAKQAEGKQYVSSINKGQQAYFAEKGSFANSVEALGLGLKSETTNYKYSTSATKQAAFSYGVSKLPQLKNFIGGVFVVPAKQVDTKAAKDKMTTVSTLCKADSDVTTKPAEPTYQSGKIACVQGTTEVTE